MWDSPWAAPRIGSGARGATESAFVPSPRLLAVIALVALGGLAGLFSAGDSGTAQVSAVRGGLMSGTSALDVAAENQQDGTNGWNISPARAAAKGLTGYAGAVSATAGEAVPLYLKAKGAVRARAFRLGWYDGTGARQVWTGSFQATGQSGAPASWTATGTLDTTGWPEGTYLIRLDHAKASRYVPLTITSGTSAAGRTVVLTSPMTWAATAKNGSVATARTVRLDRPLATGAGGGGLVAAAGLIAQIERSGTDLVYLTDADLAADPDLLEGASAVLVAGQSRFWTTQMRGALRAALNSGTDLALFGSGTASAAAVLDPTDERSFTVAELAAKAVSGLTASTAACRTSGSTGLTVADASWWGYQGGQVEDGEVLPRLVSGESDQQAAGSGAQLLGSAALGCGDTQATSYLERDSGARVFAAGTEAWACTVTGVCENARGRRVKADPRSQEVAALVTRNVVEAFAAAS